MPAVVVSSYLPDEKPFDSEKYDVLGVECVNEFSYWAGINYVWQKGYDIVNVEHDMEFSDELVTGLLECPETICAYPYTVFPTKLGRFIYCGTHDRITDEEAEAGRKPGWIEPGEPWADWHSIGFVKIGAAAQVKPLDKMFWTHLEHSIDRIVSIHAGLKWHLHWPGVKHYHDYDRIPDHLW